jgi:cytochrome P450
MTTDTGSITAAAAAASGCPYRPDFDPFSEPYLSDPYTWLAGAREASPIFYSPEIDYFVVTRYEDVRAIFRNPETFSPTPTTEPMTPPYPSTIEEIMKWGRAIQYLTGPTLVNEDEPEHMQRRRYITPPFLPAAVAKLEPHIREYTNDYLDRLVKRGSGDLVDDFVWEIPVRVLFRAMGIPDEEAHYVKEFTAERALFTWGRPTEEKQRQMAGEVGAFAEYCEKHVARLRENLGDDITSTFIRFNQEQPELFTDLMVHSYLINFMFAGHETTTSGAASLFLNLLQHREQWEAVCNDPSLIPNAVEEILRFNPPLVAWHRRTLKETNVGGIDLPVGARLLVVIAAANRDPAVFEEPEKFNIFRTDARKHLAFGFGNHTCLGATIARVELRIFSEGITRRLPHMPDQKFEYSANASFRGPRHVLATWDAAANPIVADRA